MAPWRHTAASLFTVSAVLLTGQTAASATPPPAVTQSPRQGLRAAAQFAADEYRQERRRILLAYRDATRGAHHRLRLALRDAADEQQRQDAWRVYADETGPLRRAANRQMQQARAEFRAAVERARDMFGVPTTASTFATIR
ncbi:MAG: hypothetical protein KDC08_12415 [Actinobacteria bacterium]|nr:hypothetical protein [Actinomycetota bacterium]